MFGIQLWSIEDLSGNFVFRVIIFLSKFSNVFLAFSRLNKSRYEYISNITPLGRKDEKYFAILVFPFSRRYQSFGSPIKREFTGCNSSKEYYHV